MSGESRGSDRIARRRKKDAMTMDDMAFIYNVVMLGDGGVGKSSVTVMFVSGKFVSVYDPTVEDCYNKTTVVDGVSHVLEIMDTAGQENYRALRDQYMTKGEGFVVVYSMANRQSLANVPRNISDICRHKECNESKGVGVKDMSIMVAGNKKDLKRPDRQVKKKEAKELMEQISREHENMGHMFCSAKESLNVFEIFHTLIRMMWERRKIRMEEEIRSRPQRRCIIY